MNIRSEFIKWGVLHIHLGDAIRDRDHICSLLTRLSHVNAVVLTGSEIDDRLFRVVVRIPGLEQLYVRQARISMKALVDLRYCHNLAVLELSDVPLNRGVMTAISSLDLKFLKIRTKSRPLDGWTPPSGAWSSLFVLELPNSPVSRRDLAAFASCRDLRRLDLSGTSIRDVDLKALLPFQKLTSLDLSETAVSGEGIDQIANLSRLAELKMNGCPIDDESCRALEGLAAIESLSLASTFVTDRGIVALRHLRQLIVLDLSNTQTSDHVLDQLSGSKSLRAVIDRDGNRLPLK